MSGAMATAETDEVVVDVLSDRRQLERLDAQWDELWSRSPNAGPYNHRKWVTTWLDHFQDGDGLVVLVAKADGELEAVAPFVRSRVVAPLRPLATLIAAGAELADDGEPLLGPNPSRAAQAIARHLVEFVGCTTTSVLLPRLPDDGALFEAVQSVTNARSADARSAASVVTASTPRLSLRFGEFDDPESTLARLAKKRDVPRLRRRLDERSSVEFLRHDDSPAAFETMLDLQRAVREAGDEQGLFSSRRSTEFARCAFAALAAEGVAELAVLRADGAPFAFGLGYVAGSRYVGHKLAYDADFKKFGPGLMMIDALAADALGRGLVEYDMGRGASTYKQHWCNHQRNAVSLAMLRRGRLGSIQLAGQRVVASQRIRRLRT